jgi:preprotein translocase subunit SecG
VFLPLLLYNTAMGFAYTAAGISTWSNLNRGMYAAAAIFIINFLVLGIIGYLYAVGASVAVESVRAMIFRTVVWFVLFLGLAWICSRRTLAGKQHA